MCRPKDLALSGLTTVIGHQKEKNWILVDAGWMALSRDRGTANQKVDQGHGLVCDEQGKVIPDLIVSGANQEHGIVSRRGGGGAVPKMLVGTRLRVLPNHACATGAQHGRYNARYKDGRIASWERFGGW